MFEGEQQCSLLKIRRLQVSPSEEVKQDSREETERVRSREGAESEGQA